MFRRRQTAEEQYQQNVVTPQQEQQAAHVEKQVKDARPGWRDRLPESQKARGRVPYDENHPRHPRNRR